MEYVVDTNVPLTALGAANHMSSGCQLRCSEWLGEFLMEEKMLVIDSGLGILGEYTNAIAYEGQANVGRQFLRWVLTNYANPYRVRQVDITQIASNNYSGLPASLNGFDPNDKKFLAVAIVNNSNEKTTIVQAADGKWVNWQPELTAAGIIIEYPCYAELVLFAKKNS
jgi:hypothetical protein